VVMAPRSLDNHDGLTLVASARSTMALVSVDLPDSSFDICCWVTLVIAASSLWVSPAFVLAVLRRSASVISGIYNCCCYGSNNYSG